MFGKLAEPEQSNDMLKVAAVERTKTLPGVIVSCPGGHSEAGANGENIPSVIVIAANASSHFIFIPTCFWSLTYKNRILGFDTLCAVEV